MSNIENLEKEIKEAGILSAYAQAKLDAVKGPVLTPELIHRYDYWYAEWIELSHRHWKLKQEWKKLKGIPTSYLAR